jgi:biotin operon repressor
LLLCGAQDDHDTAGRAAMLGYILKSQFAPQSLDELGLRLGISKQAAHKRLTTFRRKCAEILAF